MRLGLVLPEVADLLDGEERADVQGRGALLRVRSKQTAGSAWLVSGLLRRVGLWRTVGVPLSTAS
ncbi:hypothetical protein ACR820_02900 [Streptomyces netropsis]